MSATAETDPQTIEPDYRPIDPELEASLLREALAANPEITASNSPFALLTIRGDSPYSNVARSLEGRVFDHYFGNDPEVMKREYGAYEESSSFFLLVDRENARAAGVMRIIHPGQPGFKSMNDLTTPKCRTLEDEAITGLDQEGLKEELGIDPAIALDVATIAAHPEYGAKARGDEVVLSALMRAVYHYSLSRGYDDLVAIIDKVPLDKLRMVGLPIRTSPKIASPFVYLGAQGNTFISIPIPGVEQAVRTVSDGAYEYVFGEQELGGSVVLSFHEQ